MILNLTTYCIGRATKALVPSMFPKSKGGAKALLGSISIFGPHDFVGQCVEGINVILPMYDQPLHQTMITGPISLCFYYEENHFISYHTAGLYAIPCDIVKFQSHGICQHIVWRYFQSSETGVGLLAAYKDTPKLH